MLTHPGTSIVPSALVAAEVQGASGKEFITGLAAGYEVMERMAADFIPTVMAQRLSRRTRVFVAISAPRSPPPKSSASPKTRTQTRSACARILPEGISRARPSARALQHEMPCWQFFSGEARTSRR